MEPESDLRSIYTYNRKVEPKVEDFCLWNFYKKHKTCCLHNI